MMLPDSPEFLDLSHEVGFADDTVTAIFMNASTLSQG